MLLRSSKLKFAYPNSPGFSFPDLNLEAGEAALLLGPSGSGKSTLMHLIAGLLPLKHGEITVLNTPFSQLTEREKEKFRAQNMGLVFQRSYFLPYLSLRENLILTANYQGHKTKLNKIDSLFSDLQIDHLAHKKPSDCSLGEQQRASIARALLQKPRLLLADEPSSALDDQNALKVTELLLSVCKEHQSALLIVTHDQRLKDKISKSYLL
jgi:lipoprotein-releasing system ATP-binding protein